MAGTYTIDQAATFATCILMNSGPKLRFGEQVQDVSADGELKWECSLAVTFSQDRPGMKPVSEVITVTITGGDQDPAANLSPGQMVELVGLRVGISTPEKRDNGRVSGGRAWHQATGLRPASQHQARKPEAA